LTVEAIDVHGVWWRQLPFGSDPLFRAEPPSDGRWQRGEVVGALYFADSEETAWAEWYRALAEFAIPPDRQMPRDLWRWQIDVEDADLSNREALREVGLPLPRPTQSEWPTFQGVGERLWREGYAGMLGLSGSRPESLTLHVPRRGRARRSRADQAADDLPSGAGAAPRDDNLTRRLRSPTWGQS
jgi:RES domain-containing protein